MGQRERKEKLAFKKKHNAPKLEMMVFSDFGSVSGQREGKIQTPAEEKEENEWRVFMTQYLLPTEDSREQCLWGGCLIQWEIPWFRL